MNDPLNRLKTALADRYAIEREIGAGGMATVYLAEDLKHQRKVAVKVLRPELAAVVGAERFLREIQIAARLNHPHILTLIDSGEEDGFLYYVMPHVQGESLRDKLARERQLSIEEAVAIAQDVASALGYAHAQGVIHRDIKPGNILMHEGEAIVADFGIALALQAAAGQRLTETGLSLGTPEYMSPEQATADHQLDARSDIYSMGAVLYEMLAGDPPFTGRSTQAVIAKLLTERPTPVRILRDTIPEAVEQAVMKALAKVPADRFKTAGDFAEVLKAVGTETTLVRGGPRVRQRARKRRPQLLTVGLVDAGVLGLGLLAYQLGTGGWGSSSRDDAPGLDGRRVAVLYFEDLSSDGALEFFAYGLTEGLIDKLARRSTCRGWCGHVIAELMRSFLDREVKGHAACCHPSRISWHKRRLCGPSGCVPSLTP